MAQPQNILEPLQNKLQELENKLREKTQMNTRYKETALRALRDILARIRDRFGIHAGEVQGHRDNIAQLQQQQKALDSQVQGLGQRTAAAEEQRNAITAQHGQVQADLARLNELSNNKDIQIIDLKRQIQTETERLTRDIQQQQATIQNYEKTIAEINQQATQATEIIRNITQGLGEIITRLDAIIQNLDAIVTQGDQNALDAAIKDINDVLGTPRNSGNAEGSVQQDFKNIDYQLTNTYGITNENLEGFGPVEKAILLNIIRSDQDKEKYKAMNHEQLRIEITKRPGSSGGRRTRRRRNKRGGYRYTEKKRRRSSSASSYRPSTSASQSQSLAQGQGQGQGQAQV